MEEAAVQALEACPAAHLVAVVRSSSPVVQNHLEALHYSQTAVDEGNHPVWGQIHPLLLAILNLAKATAAVHLRRRWELAGVGQEMVRVRHLVRIHSAPSDLPRPLVERKPQS